MHALFDTSSLNSPSPGFFALPAEIRNSIYEYSLVEDEEIDIITLLPPTLLVYKQMRSETIAIHLGRNVFVTNIYRGDYDHLLDWLECLGKDNLLDPKHLTIACHWGDIEDFVKEHRPDFYTEFKAWHEFVDRLVRFDLRASQLKWPGVTHTILDRVIASEVEHRHFFYTYLLAPLLAHNFLMDDASRPPDMLSELRQYTPADSCAHKSRRLSGLIWGAPCSSFPEIEAHNMTLCKRSGWPLQSE